MFDYPKWLPKRFNANSDPCDSWEGPCSCGAWHRPLEILGILQEEIDQGLFTDPLTDEAKGALALAKALRKPGGLKSSALTGGGK